MLFAREAQINGKSNFKKRHGTPAVTVSPQFPAASCEAAANHQILMAHTEFRIDRNQAVARWRVIAFDQVIRIRNG